MRTYFLHVFVALTTVQDCIAAAPYSAKHCFRGVGCSTDIPQRRNKHYLFVGAWKNTGLFYLFLPLDDTILCIHARWIVAVVASTPFRETKLCKSYLRNMHMHNAVMLHKLEFLGSDVSEYEDIWKHYTYQHQIEICQVDFFIFSCPCMDSCAHVIFFQKMCCIFSLRSAWYYTLVRIAPSLYVSLFGWFQKSLFPPAPEGFTWCRLEQQWKWIRFWRKHVRIVGEYELSIP